MLMINGDDFGMTESCSKAIAAALAEGLITDTTMVANGEYFEEAVGIAKAQGFADRVGIHFNITEGVPLTGKIAVMPEFVVNGRFHKGFDGSSVLSDVQREAVFEELCAQAQKLRDAGFEITHADSHHYIHTKPAFLPVVAEVCRMFGIKRVRLCRNLCCRSQEESHQAQVINERLRAYGFITTQYFGRLRDMSDGKIPEDTELLVHPDFYKDGVLIDRTGMADGYPVGERLAGLEKIIQRLAE